MWKKYGKPETIKRGNTVNLSHRHTLDYMNQQNMRTNWREYEYERALDIRIFQTMVVVYLFYDHRLYHRLLEGGLIIDVNAHNFGQNLHNEGLINERNAHNFGQNLHNEGHNLHDEEGVVNEVNAQNFVHNLQDEGLINEANAQKFWTESVK